MTETGGDWRQVASSSARAAGDLSGETAASACSLTPAPQRAHTRQRESDREL
jgi:hypothetical protein